MACGAGAGAGLTVMPMSGTDYHEEGDDDEER